MKRVVLGLPSRDAERNCVFCGAEMPCDVTPVLVLLDGAGAPVCLECGQKFAPELAALIDVARIAEHVGRVNHHNRSWPVMDALLKLARASERYYLSLARKESAA